MQPHSAPVQSPADDTGVIRVVAVPASSVDMVQWRAHKLSQQLQADGVAFGVTVAAARDVVLDGIHPMLGVELELRFADAGTLNHPLTGEFLAAVAGFRDHVPTGKDALIPADRLLAAALRRADDQWVTSYGDGRGTAAQIVLEARRSGTSPARPLTSSELRQVEEIFSWADTPSPHDTPWVRKVKRSLRLRSGDGDRWIAQSDAGVAATAARTWARDRHRVAGGGRA